jgi:hypothetical protein
VHVSWATGTIAALSTPGLGSVIKSGFYRNGFGRVSPALPWSALVA